jgi:hypothetical protein
MEMKDDDGYWAVKYLGRSYYKVTPMESAFAVIDRVGRRLAQTGRDGKVVLVAIVREVFGNPFQPIRIDPTWLTWNNGAIVKLAKNMYDAKTFDLMPELGQAMREAGWQNDEILNHCQKKGLHCRGCWVVDLVMGKE